MFLHEMHTFFKKKVCFMGRFCQPSFFVKIANREMFLGFDMSIFKNLVKNSIFLLLVSTSVFAGPLSSQEKGAVEPLNKVGSLDGLSGESVSDVVSDASFQTCLSRSGSQVSLCSFLSDPCYEASLFDVELELQREALKIRSQDEFNLVKIAFSSHWENKKNAFSEIENSSGADEALLKARGVLQMYPNSFYMVALSLVKVLKKTSDIKNLCVLDFLNSLKSKMNSAEAQVISIKIALLSAKLPRKRRCQPRKRRCQPRSADLPSIRLAWL